MPRIPTAAEAVLLRLIEIAETYVLVLNVPSERAKLERDWLEVMPTAFQARDVLKEELANGE